MIPENIIEICVAIDIAILGIAYPIIIDKISNVGDKYSSHYLSEIFKYEFPNQIIIHIRKLGIEWSIFKTTLILTISSFIFLIFKFKPLFGLDNYWINNSAKLFVLLLSSILTIIFFSWIDKVALFNGKQTKMLKHVIRKYRKAKNDTTRGYYMKAINELSTYAIRNQDEHLQQTLLEFYQEVFQDLRNNHVNEAN